MRLRIYDPRILAIDLRHRRFGYAVFEGHRLLLGWGVRTYPAVGEAEAAMVSDRLATVLKLFSPEAIVVTKERWERAHTNVNLRSVELTIMRIARGRSIPICCIGQDQVKASFRNLGCETRYEIASALARIFPELAWRLPRPRHPWEPEHSSMIIFDAIALGLAYWQHPSKRISSPE